MATRRWSCDAGIRVTLQHSVVPRTLIEHEVDPNSKVSTEAGGTRLYYAHRGGKDPSRLMKKDADHLLTLEQDQHTTKVNTGSLSSSK